MDTIKGAFGFSKKPSLGNWEALSQADPELGITSDAMKTNVDGNMGLEMTTFKSNQLQEAAPESSGLFSSITSSISKLTGTSEVEAEPVQDQSIGTTIVMSIINRLPEMPEMSYLQRMAGFAMFLLAGLLMLAYCMMILPKLVFGGAAKFAMSYVLANVFLLSSSCFILTPSKQVSVLFHESRRLVTLAYLSSMTITVFASLYMPSMFIVLPCLILQFASLLWYICSFSPCGTSALNSVATSVISSSLGLGSSQ